MPRPSELLELCHEPRAEDDGVAHRFVLEVPLGLPVVAEHFPGAPILPAFVELLEVLGRVQRVFPELGPWRGAVALKFQAPIRPGVRLELWLRRPREATSVRFTLDALDVEPHKAYASGTLVFGPRPEERT